jgi:hypothetical protein
MNGVHMLKREIGAVSGERYSAGKAELFRTSGGRSPATNQSLPGELFPDPYRPLEPVDIFQNL